MSSIVPSRRDRPATRKVLFGHFRTYSQPFLTGWRAHPVYRKRLLVKLVTYRIRHDRAHRRAARGCGWLLAEADDYLGVRWEGSARSRSMIRCDQRCLARTGQEVRLRPLSERRPYREEFRWPCWWTRRSVTTLLSGL